MEDTGHERRLVGAQVPVKLRPRRQAGEGCAEVALCRAIKTALTAKLLPLSKDRQREYLTATEVCLGAGMGLNGQMGFTEIIDHDIKHRQEGVDIDQRKCSLSWGRESNSIGQRHLPCNLCCELTPSV